MKRDKKDKLKESELSEYRLVPVEESNNEEPDKDSIELMILAKTIWENRKKVYKITGVFFMIGLLIAFLSPVEYSTTATLMPEFPEQNNANSAASLLKKYGGLLGINPSDLTGNGQSIINVILYPQIIQSTPFMLELMNQKIHSERYDTTVTLFGYFDHVYTPGVFGYLLKYTVGLPSLIKRSSDKQQMKIRTDTNTVHITKDQSDVIKRLSNRIMASVDDQSGIVSITSEMPEADISAIITKKTIELLKSYVTDYRTQKAQQDYDFIKGQYERAKMRFKEAQDTLAKFQDQNLSLSTAQSQTQLKSLQDEYNMTYNLYTGLAQQLEQARIQVQQNTPVFKVLEPATVPVHKTKPKRILILIVMTALGFLGGIFFFFLKDIYLKLKKEFVSV